MCIGSRVAVLMTWAVLFTTPVLAAEAEFSDDWYFDPAGSVRTNLEGGPAIELSTDTWIGEETTLDACRGKVVVLDFWATWCGPCVASIPKNIELVETYPDELVFIGMHSATSGWDKAPQMVEDRDINYPVVLDSGETAEAYGINAFPTYIIIDRDGIVRAAGVKPGHVKAIVKQLIEESGSGGQGSQLASFQRDWFYGGAQWMRAWQEQHGQPAPPIQAAAWWLPGDAIDAAPAPDQQAAAESESESESDDEAVDEEPASEAPAGDEPTSQEAMVAEAPEGLREADLEGVVRVLHFTRPGLKLTQQQLQSFNDTAARYAPQGVAFAVICDQQSDWQATRAFAAEIDLAVPMVLDAVPQAATAEDSPAPVAGSAGPPREAGRTAQAYHVRIAPVTVLVDRNGRIRATGLKLQQLDEALTLLLAERAE